MGLQSCGHHGIITGHLKIKDSEDYRTSMMWSPYREESGFVRLHEFYSNITGGEIYASIIQVMCILVKCVLMCGEFYSNSILYRGEIYASIIKVMCNLVRCVLVCFLGSLKYMGQILELLNEKD